MYTSSAMCSPEQSEGPLWALEEQKPITWLNRRTHVSPFPRWLHSPGGEAPLCIAFRVVFLFKEKEEHTPCYRVT